MSRRDNRQDALGERDAPLEPWSDVFARSSLGPDTKYMKYSRTDMEGAGCEWERLEDICKRLRLVHSEDGGFSGPGGGGAAFTAVYRGLDGMVIGKASEAFYGAKGVWVVGRKLLRLLCYEVGLSQPAMNKQEREFGCIPTHEELLNELADQLRTRRTKIRNAKDDSNPE